MSPAVAQCLRVAAVVAMLGVAAALATPPGRLPLALRGLARLLRARPAEKAKEGGVPAWRRALALALVLAAAALCCIA